MLNVTLKAFPFSYQQTRLWSFKQMGCAYYTQCLLSLEGELNTRALLEVCQQLLGQHDILRTAFYPPPGMEAPMQIVASDASAHWLVVDLENADPINQTLYSENICRESITETSESISNTALHIVLLRMA